MIDWFVSKIGLLIFVTAAAGALAAFTLIQAGLWSDSVRVETANNIARLIDAVGEGSSLNYSVGLTGYTLHINSSSLALDGIRRNFIATAEPANISDAAVITIARRGGRVTVSAA